MGQDISGQTSGSRATRAFTKALLRDVQALERMIRDGMIETGVRRLGMEQEMFFVNRGWRPAPVARDVLATLEGPFSTELALYNLEANVEPRRVEGTCFSALEARVAELVEAARCSARGFGADVVLTGILPTLIKSDPTLENITPEPRYLALNDALATVRRGEPTRLRIEGSDEVLFEHDSVMLESCNTSCQVHLQVDPEEFATFYNAAQLVAGPVLAAAVNSPVLFGRRLWSETRIALFQQSVDTRSGRVHIRELAPRVRFGDAWVESSVTELFAEDVSRYRPLLTGESVEDPIRVLRDGGIPGLRALQLNNSTVYRWNRPCYGVADGVPHLRIECRYLPAGPSIVDEVANAAFWIGCVLGLARRLGDAAWVVDFEEVKANFLAASRRGLKVGFRWLDGRNHSAPDLILDHLLPMAHDGLTEAGVAESDADRYLGVVRERVERGMTGAQWIVRSLARMRHRGTRAERLTAVTAAMADRQRTGEPVHLWKLASLHEAGGWRLNYMRVEQFMTTSLFTVREDELVGMVAFLMHREQIRQVLVEDEDHNLVGVVSYNSVLRLVAEGFDSDSDDAPPVSLIMDRDPLSVSPATPTLEAIDLMRHHRRSFLPVVENGKLVGIVSERDFLSVAYELLEEKLADEPPAADEAEG